MRHFLNYFKNLFRIVAKSRLYIPLARKYLKKYGYKATIKRTFFTIKTANFHSSTNQFVSNSIFPDSLFKLNPKVIIVSNDLNSPSHDYRVGIIASGLWESGIATSVLTVAEIHTLSTLPRETRLVIFWRTAIELELLPWFAWAKSNFVSICYDTDDLTFHPEAYNYERVWALRQIPKETCDFLAGEICQRQKKQVMESDIAISSTPEMAKYFGKLGLNSVYIPIVIPRWMEKQANELWKSRSDFLESRKDVIGIRIVYASGSPSHGEDFNSCFSGITKFLIENPSSTLTIIGSPPVSLDKFPRGIQSQIIFEIGVPHNELLKSLTRFDVQLAPLEVGNDFVEAKSATKFMQGGILAIPTIASPTEPFTMAIHNYQNGILATSTVEWYKALVYLCNFDNRKKMALMARDSAFSCHTVSSIVSGISELMKEVEKLCLESEAKVLKNTDSVQSSLPRITWLLPDYAAKSGGIQNVLRLAQLMNEKYFSCDVVFHNSFLSPDDLLERISQEYFEPDFTVSTRISLANPPEIVVSIHNSSVAYMKSHAPKRAQLVYLVQDFEPFFYPLSHTYLEALYSYFDTDLHVITSLEWMSKKIHSLTGRMVPYLDFPMDKTTYFSRNTPLTMRNGIIAYAKDDTPRRLYALLIESLQIVQNIRPDVGITFFGGGASPSFLQNLVNLGQVETNSELANLYSSSQVGIAFGPSNPSGIPYEMMSCGLPVVDVVSEAGQIPKYSGDHPHLCTPNIKFISERILRLLGDTVYWESESIKGLKLVNSMESTSLIAEKLEKFLHQVLSQKI